MKSLTEMAAQIESEEFNEKWAAHKAEFAKQEAEQEAAAHLAGMEAEAQLAALDARHAEAKAIQEAAGQPHGVVADPERVRHALEHGGRAVVTVRSWKSGKHVTIVLVARKRRPEGSGWVPRNTSAGRVGIGEADAIEARDPELEYPDNYVGRFYLDTGEWRAGKDADGARVWTAERVIAYALAGQDLQSEVFLASQCSYCGKQLTDPESIERGIGPECYGKHTKSKMQKHGEAS